MQFDIVGIWGWLLILHASAHGTAGLDSHPALRFAILGGVESRY